MPASRPLIVFDLETQKEASEVGGWGNIRAMRMSVGVTWNSADKNFHRYEEGNVADLVAELKSASLVVGYNVLRFDYEVLSYYTRENLRKLPTLDILTALYNQLGFRVKLDDVAAATLGQAKSADGMQAIRWWREGQLDQIYEYCRQDVDITRQVYEFGRKNRYVQFNDRYGGLRRVAVDW
jgi:DEAD/DEAH box helicase domain-containing protein